MSVVITPPVEAWMRRRLVSPPVLPTAATAEARMWEGLYALMALQGLEATVATLDTARAQLAAIAAASTPVPNPANDKMSHLGGKRRGKPALEPVTAGV